MIAVALILAASSFSGSGQAGAYHVETTSWTTITSFTTTSSTIETGTEIQTITIIGVVVVALLATVAALSRIIGRSNRQPPPIGGHPSHAGETYRLGKTAYQPPPQGEPFYEGYSDGIPGPQEKILLRGVPFRLTSPSSGLSPEEEEREKKEEWKRIEEEWGIHKPAGIGGPEGGVPESSEAEGPASGEGGGGPVHSSGGTGSGISTESGTSRLKGAGGGSVNQGGSEPGGPSQEPSGPGSSSPGGGPEAKGPSSDVSPPRSDESTAPTTPPIESTERTTDSVSETTPTERGEGERLPGEIPQSPPVLTPPSDQTDEKPHTVLTEDEIERTVDSGLENNRSPEDIMKDLYRRDRTRGGSGDIGLKDPLVTVNTRNGPATARQSEANAYQDALKKLSELERQDDEDFDKLPTGGNMRELFSTKEIRGGKIVRLPSHQISKARTQWSIEHGPAFGKLEHRALGRNRTDETKEQDQTHIFIAGDRG